MPADISLRRAAPGDVGVVVALLTAANLPLDGVAAAFEHGLVAEVGGVIVGAAALEPYGSDALLRSVVVAPTLHGTGIGRALVGAAEGWARELGARDLYLLTETAISWFPQLGYAQVPRDSAPAAIGASVEFTISCVDTGVLLVRRLPGS